MRDEKQNPPIQSQPVSSGEFAPLIYEGYKLDFDTQTLDFILSKYFPYYRALDAGNRQRFVNRLRHFMKVKTFVINSRDGYREMPVLISAAAIQLTFGLQDYLLSWFKYICIHPEEYLVAEPLRELAGNVSGNTITLSWKHFLADYQIMDGVNVGLHEMAHALQLQHAYTQKAKDREFRLNFSWHNNLNEKILEAEKASPSKLFTEYALSSPDEFWASSIEIFFEQPATLHALYPQLYKAIVTVLNQDPMLLSNVQHKQ